MTDPGQSPVPQGADVSDTLAVPVPVRDYETLTHRHVYPAGGAPAVPVPVRDYETLTRRVWQAVSPPLTCRVYGQQRTPTPGEAYDLLLVRMPVRRARFHVLLNGGTHGDEWAGPEAVVRFLEERRYARWPDIEFTITPCTNPWGYVHNTREGPFGADLNRSFRRANARAPQISLLKRALRRQRFDLFIDCHEDVDTPGLYVFAPQALGQAIVAATRPLGPIHPGPLVDDVIPVQDGVVALDDRARERRLTSTTWPFPMYVARYHRRVEGPDGRSRPRTPNGTGVTPPEAVEQSQVLKLVNGASADPLLMRSATVETPTKLAIDQRVAMHHAAIDAALATLTEK